MKHGVLIVHCKRLRCKIENCYTHLSKNCKQTILKTFSNNKNLLKSVLQFSILYLNRLQCIEDSLETRLIEAKTEKLVQKSLLDYFKK